jgi:dihydrofolate reductase
MSIAIIAMMAAMTHGRVLGRDNHISWHMPRDLRRFRQFVVVERQGEIDREARVF